MTIIGLKLIKVNNNNNNNNNNQNQTEARNPPYLWLGPPWGSWRILREHEKNSSREGFARPCQRCPGPRCFPKEVASTRRGLPCIGRLARHTYSKLQPQWFVSVFASVSEYILLQSWLSLDFLIGFHLAFPCQCPWNASGIMCAIVYTRFYLSERHLRSQKHWFFP